MTTRGHCRCVCQYLLPTTRQKKNRGSVLHQAWWNCSKVTWQWGFKHFLWFLQNFTNFSVKKKSPKVQLICDFFFLFLPYYSCYYNWYSAVIVLSFYWPQSRQYVSFAPVSPLALHTFHDLIKSQLWKEPPVCCFIFLFCFPESLFSFLQGNSHITCMPGTVRRWNYPPPLCIGKTHLFNYCICLLLLFYSVA